MNKKSIKITAIILLAIIMAGGGYFGFKKYKSSKSTVSTNNYLVETVRKGQIDVGVQATGTIFAAVTKEIVTNNSGELKDLSVKIGDTVKSGDKLFKVDSDQIKQQLTSAELNVEKQKLQAGKAQTEDEINMQNLSLKEAENNYNNVKQQYNDMTVKSPISGLVTVRNGNPGDNVQSGKSILTIMDTTSLKVKASVDELDIAKVQKGQKVTVKLNALPDKTFEGTVETISDVGSTQNNVTSYEVVITLNDSTGIKLGMTASVNIEIASKQDALLVPLEALVQRNGKYYVMTSSTEGTNSTNSANGTNNAAGTKDTNGTNSQGSQPQANNNSQQPQNSNGQSQRNSQGYGYNGGQRMTQSGGKLTEVKIGLQNENYAEVTEGLTEGQKLLVAIPTGSTTTTTNNRAREMGGFGGGMINGGTRTPNIKQ